MNDTITKDEMKAIDSCIRTVEAIGTVFALTDYQAVLTAKAALRRLDRMPGYLHAERQNVTVPADRLLRLDDILRRLPTMEEPTREEPTREQVAAVVRTGGMAAYIGGRHISVHTPDANGEPNGVCLLIITGNYGDWL